MPPPGMIPLGIALAYILGFLTPVIITLIFYTVARVEPKAANQYRSLYCSGLATGT
jgi:hypothetical protein